MIVRRIPGLLKRGSFIIYNYGVEKVPIKIDRRNGTGGKNSDNIWLNGSSSNYGRVCLQTTSLINLTSYTKAYVYLNVTANVSPYPNFFMISPEQNVAGTGLIPGSVASKRPLGTGSQTIEIDISALSGFYYVGYYIDYLNIVYVYKMWVR